jgi:uncharacterized protein
MAELDTTFYVVALLAALLVGLSKGGLSMMGALATPILALVISPVTAAAILLPIFVVSDAFGLWSYRHAFDRRNLMILVPAGTLGIALGWATASLVSDRWVTFLIGVIGCVFCIGNWLRRSAEVRPHEADIPRGIFWGTIMGFASFVAHVGGPPYQVYVYPQRLPKVVYAGTTTIVFAIVNFLKLIPYWALGQFSAANLKASALLIPLAVGGTLAGVRLVRVIPEKIYFNFVQLMLLVVSIKLITDAFRL